MVTATVPDDWRAVLPPAPETEGARCANWAMDAWNVSLSKREDTLVIRSAPPRGNGDTIAVKGGRLTSVNHGEFGGEVWWEPAAGMRSRVASLNLLAFLTTRSGVYGLEGLAHLSLDYGHLVRFERTVGGSWRVREVLDLGAAPTAYAAFPGDTILVATHGSLLAVRPPEMVRVLHRNDVWSFSSPNSVVRDRTGVMHVGMRSAVARLTPIGEGYQEEWLVQHDCPRRRPSGKLAECECVRS